MGDRHSITVIVVCFVEVCSCGGVTTSADGGDASIDASGNACLLPLCGGTVDLPVGALMGGDDLCEWECADAGALTCIADSLCGCASSEPQNICDGGEGPVASPELGPSCAVQTCSGLVALPYRAVIFGADGCRWTCGADGVAGCAPFTEHEDPCVCGESQCAH